MRYYTDELPEPLKKNFESDLDALCTKHHKYMRAAVRALVNFPLKRIKFGKLTMGMGTYYIDGELSYTDEYGDVWKNKIHEFNTDRSGKQTRADYGITDEEETALEQLFAILDFWLELTGGQDMEL